MNEQEQQGSRAVVPANQASPPGDVDQAITLARAFAESGYFADARGWAQALVKIQAGRELGFGPMASMTGIHVIKGKVTLGANLIAAAIRRSSRYDYRVMALNDHVCQLIFFANGKEVGESVFTLEDARRADLAKGDNWKRYPRNMLFARAISNGAKWYCPDIFACGAYADGELDEEPEPVRVPAQVVAVQAARPARPAAAPEPPTSNGHAGPMTAAEMGQLVDLRRQLFESRGLDRNGGATLWAEILGRWGVKSANDLTLAQRQELVGYLIAQIQLAQLQQGLTEDVDNIDREEAPTGADGGSA